MKNVTAYTLLAISMSLACTTGHYALAAEKNSAKAAITSFTASSTTVTTGEAVELTGVFANGYGVIFPGNIAATSGVAVSVTPKDTTTYTLVVIDTADGISSKAVTVMVTPAAPAITSFAASPASITAGASTSLTGVFSNGKGVIMPGNMALTSGAAISVSPKETTTYVLTVTNSAGVTSLKAAKVTVTQAAPAITSFAASPASITAGASTSLTGVFSNGKGVIMPGNIAVTSGVATSVTPKDTTTYTLIVTNSVGVTASKAVTVTVTQAAPAITSFAASPASITAGASSSLTGVFSNGKGVIMPVNIAVTSGAATSVTPKDTTTYTLIVTNSAGVSASKAVTVTVTPAAPAITSFAASPASIMAGTSTSLTGVFSNGKGVVTPGNITVTSGTAVSVLPKDTTTYTLTVTNSAGVSAVKAITVTVTPDTIPAAPTGLTAVAGSGAVALSWTASTGATSYKIYRGTTSGGESATAVASGVSSTHYSDSSVTNGDEYFYKVAAVNSAGTSPLSNEASATPKLAKPTISSFLATPATIASGSSSTLSWAAAGATSIAIAPGGFTSTVASGSTSVSPTATTSYTLTASNTAGSATATVKVTVAAASTTLKITTTTCPGGTQLAEYAGCTLVASGGTPPYTFSLSTDLTDYPPLPEGMSLDAATGVISSSLIGGQGTYIPEFVVADSTGAKATQTISFAINGSNTFLANIFPSTSIFHHRVDAATTGLPVDTSPAANMYSGYLPETIKPFFGDQYANFPNGIPAIEVPYNQPDVAVSTTLYQSYFTSGPIPPYAPIEGTANGVSQGGDGHVLVYLEAGDGKKPALYEMWQGIYLDGPWTDSSNALWPDVTSNNLTPQGNGTSDAAGLPVGPLLVNADEVIGTGTPSAPNGAVEHPIRFTLNHMLNYWVWPATETAGVGYCTTAAGADIPVESEIAQSSSTATSSVPYPATCSMTGAAGEIYRLKASVETPACAATSPQAAVIIQGFRNYGIILADNGDSGGLIGTPDARWNNNDLSCLTSLTLSDFEPVNVSSLMVSTDSGATSK
jgi:fibronectin type 3 domain-containing protein